MRIGFANGCFDLHHHGHFVFIQECLRQCDHLIVAVNSDASVRQLKGPARPVDSFEKRFTWVAGHFRVSAIPFEGDPEPLLQAIRPQVLFRGEDQRTFHVEHGLIGELVVIPRLPGLSTTLILQAHAQP